MRSLRSLICASVGVEWLASLSDKPNPHAVGHDPEWLFVCALDVKQNPLCVGPIDLDRVKQPPVKPGELLPNAGHLRGHMLRLWAK